MRLNEVSFDGRSPVDGYGPGFFRIGGKVWRGAVLVSPSGIAAWGGFDDLSAITALAGDVDVVFIGTGASVAYLPGPLIEAAAAAGIGVEPMASPTACRTYNVLLSEGRRVGLAVLPV